MPTSRPLVALGQLQQHGFCILSEVIAPATTAHLRERAIAAAMEHDTGQSEATWHVSSALTYEQSFAEQIAHPRVLEVLAGAMAVAPRELRVSYTTLQVNKPRCLETTPRWHNGPQPGCPAPTTPALTLHPSAPSARQMRCSTLPRW